MKKYDVIIIGASASGLMCAAAAAKRGRQVCVIDHANKAGKKILMSGGGKCNFTNYQISSENYISQNPHFCKSALSRYTQWDFIALVDKYKIPYHERSHGQLFCNESAKDILNMLLKECEKADVTICLNTNILSVEREVNDLFEIQTQNAMLSSESLVIACGGLSIPKMCASPYGYQLAEQFNINLIPTSAGLVPFTLQPEDKEKYSALTGIAIDSLVSCHQFGFRENILFTHRGLSGPAILQISSYWKPGQEIEINLLPELELITVINDSREKHPNKQLKTILEGLLPKRLIKQFIPEEISQKPLQLLSKKNIETITKALQQWRIKPNGTEGYRTAEVTLGGVDCSEISSKTFESNKVKGLYFVGEVLDVTGWLGGYNFQWAWSSGWCAGQYV